VVQPDLRAAESNFSANQNFPMGIGKSWERFLQEYVSNCDTPVDGPERNRRRFYGIINKAKSDVLRSPLSIVNDATAPAGGGTLVEDM
jgi:hypothetical protein